MKKGLVGGRVGHEMAADNCAVKRSSESSHTPLLLTAQWSELNEGWETLALFQLARRGKLAPTASVTPPMIELLTETWAVDTPFSALLYPFWGGTVSGVSSGHPDRGFQCLLPVSLFQG